MNSFFMINELKKRKIEINPEGYLKFFNPSLDNLHNPNKLKDIDEAVVRIKSAIDNKENILVYGDFDVDGLTSTALLVNFFEKEYNLKLDYYIPNRLNEGYGLNKEALDKINKNIDLIITVDCGIKAYEEIDYAKKLGFDIIVTDHHTPPDKPLNCLTINPKQKNCKYPYENLSGCGVAFKLIQVLSGKNVIELNEYLELVALANIADIVELLDENRILTKAGLENIRNKINNKGLKKLIETEQINLEYFDENDISYTIAPLLNSAGRMKSAELGVKLLISNSDNEITEIIKELKELNDFRKEITQNIYRNSKEIIENENENDIIIFSFENLHKGVLGIVASKLVEEYNKPALVLNIEGEFAEGSGRSPEDYNLYESLNKHRDLLINFGGHEFACGLKMKKDNIDKLQNKLNNNLVGIKSKENLIYELELSNINLDFINEINKFKPFGAGNPKFLFKSVGINPKSFKTTKDKKHLKFFFEKNIEGIAFNKGHLISKLLEWSSNLTLIYHLEINRWQGNIKMQLLIKDIIFPNISFVDKLFLKQKEHKEDAYFRKLPEQNNFYTKLSGVTFDDCQITIANKFNSGEEIYFEREPNNPYDEFAIKVVTKESDKLGFVPNKEHKKIATYLAPYLDAGVEYKVIGTKTGENQDLYGINIHVERLDKINNYQNENLDLTLRNKLKNQDYHKIIEKLKKEIIGDNNFRPKQQKTLSYLHAGQNVLTIMGTNRGKSAIFQTYASLQAIKHNKITIILYPLRALINDQYNLLNEKVKNLGLNVVQAKGGLPTESLNKLKKDFKESKIDIMLTTPEFLNFHLKDFAKNKDNIGLFVIDEAHHLAVSTLYRKSYFEVPQIIKKLGKPQILTVTATANKRVAQKIKEKLDINKIVIDDFKRDNLKLIDVRKYANRKKEYIKKVIETKNEKTFIYVNSRQESLEIAEDLRIEFPDLKNKIAFYNSDLINSERNKIEKLFKENKIKIIVSTSAFGEGVNIQDIRHTILYHIPFNIIMLNQIAGRAGRDNKNAYIHLLYSAKDQKLNNFILETTSPSIDKIKSLNEKLLNLANQDNIILYTIKELADMFRHEKLNEQLITSIIRILEELEILNFNNIEIKLLDKKEINKKLLKKSVLYNEGQKNKLAFNNFCKILSNYSIENLNDLIKTPIIPYSSIESSTTTSK